jgi:hypothetical protein
MFTKKAEGPGSKSVAVYQWQVKPKAIVKWRVKKGEVGLSKSDELDVSLAKPRQAFASRVVQASGDVRAPPRVVIA